MSDNVEKSLSVIQEWYKKYNNQTIATTSCGATASLLIDLIHRSRCNIPVIFVDTGFLFEDTVEYFQRLRHMYRDLFFLRLKSNLDKAAYMDKGGEIKDVERCCRDNKVIVLDEFLENNNIKCWFSALRKDQSNVREGMSPIQRDKRGIYKVLPVFEWSAQEVFTYIHERNLPLHPLFNQGYESIGCEPCTKAGSGREGRWSDTTKTECGLHL